MSFLKKAFRYFVDLFEIYLPVIVFIAMFLVFIFNIVTRYVFNWNHPWTMEWSTGSFVIVGLLGVNIAHRYEDHVVFDLLYIKMGQKTKNIFRILSNLLVIVAFGIATPYAIMYLDNMNSFTPLLKIPYKYIFSVYAIMLIFATIRSIYRLVLDIKALGNKTYDQTYNAGEKEALI